MKTKISSLLRKVIVISLILLLYTAFFQAMYCWMRYDTITGGVDLVSWVESLLYNYIPILILGLGIIWVCNATLSFKSLPLKIIVDLLAAGVILVLVNVAFLLVTHLPINWGGTIFNGIIVMFGVEFWLLSRQKQKSLIRENLLSRENMTMKYEIQKAYVNPHFLYNTLDMLSALIEDGENKEALDFIMRLSSYYRMMLRKYNHSLTPLSDELEMVRNYLEITKYNHDDSLSMYVEGDIDSDQPVIPCSIQLLVENVLKHNIVNASSPVRIMIGVNEDGITVSNNTNPKIDSAKKTTGLGLSYLKTLYAYHGKQIEIEDTPVKFTVRLPNLTFEN